MMYYIVATEVYDGKLCFCVLDMIPCSVFTYAFEDRVFAGYRNICAWGIMAVKDCNRTIITKQEFENLYGKINYP